MNTSSVVNIQTMMLTNEQAAQYLCIDAGTLNNWRSRGEGPVPTKLGRLVRYHIRELDKFIAQNTQKLAIR